MTNEDPRGALPAVLPGYALGLCGSHPCRQEPQGAPLFKREPSRPRTVVVSGGRSCTRDTAAGSAPEAARDVRHPRERRRGHDFRCAECRLRLAYSRPLAAGAPALLRPGGTLAVGSEPGMSVEAPSKRYWNP